MTATPALPAKFGRYRVVKQLGRGAMGIVYLAEDTEIARRVAIKTIALTGDDPERDRLEARFRQEARAAGGVSHPAIVTIYDVGREGDVAFIAMELVEGRELRDLIQSGVLTPSQAVEFAALIADALAFAHERGVIHRDIKPGNIMVLPDGRVKLMDFGIARLSEPTVKTQTGQMLGSPQYMSPEQIAGDEVDGRADVFSLGVVLYEMVTGLKPFDAPDLSQVLFWVVNMPAKPPSERRPGLPVVLDYIVARALKKKAAERYATAAEFAADLRRAADEVRAAEAALSMIRGDTMPLDQTMPLSEDRVELRPARGFDGSEAMARLSVIPREAGNESRAGWTVQAMRPRRRLDRAHLILGATYAVAALLALAIVVL